MYPHRIRLRGPWECEPLTWSDERANESLPSSRRVTMPCHLSDAGFSGFVGRVRFSRRFGYPGRIDTYERVWLIFEGVPGESAVRLNDRVLGQRNQSAGAFEFDVTPLLEARNELVVDVDVTADQSASWGETALEIRCTAYLRGLRRSIIVTGQRAEMHVTGQVVGTAERALELYLVVDRSVAAYQVVTATEEGQPFELVAADLSTEGRSHALPVKVDLVNGAIVWYTNEEEVTFEATTDPGN
jgi:hypothetical protein